jgi:hypothetical protein
MSNAFDPNANFDTADLNGVDGTNKDKVVHVGALQVGSKFLTQAELAMLDAGGEVGAVGAATVTADEKVIGDYHFTKLTLAAFAVGTSGDAANLALGAKIYTFPAGTIVVDDVSFVGGITAAISVTTDTPEVGIGTVVGSGVNATLSTTGEDIMEGGAAGYTGGTAVAPDVAGTAFSKGRINGGVPVVILATGGKSHDIFLNVADGWADVTAAGAVTADAVITLRWRKID